MPDKNERDYNLSDGELDAYLSGAGNSGDSVFYSERPRPVNDLPCLEKHIDNQVDSEGSR